MNWQIRHTPTGTECVYICCLHPFSGVFLGGGATERVMIRHSESGVGGELEQRDGLHLSAWLMVKWSSLRID